MKTMGKISVLLLNIFYLATMGIGILISHFEYTFEPYNYVAFAAVLVTIITVLFYFAIANKNIESKLSRISVSILTLSTLIFLTWDITFFLEEYPIVTTVVSVISAITSILIIFHLKAYKVLKFVSMTISFLLSAPVTLLLVVGILFSNFGSTEIQKTLLSPDQQSVAEVVYYDQGALGGDLQIRVYKYNNYINVLVGKIYFFKNPKPVCGEVELGRYFKTDDMYWEDNDTLNVNGRSFDV